MNEKNSAAKNPMSELFKKYDVPAPRYTSYPTVPYWTDNPTTTQWLDAVKDGLKPESASWSLYVHVPFCETLCTFCGCNTSITKDHGRENPYVNVVLNELDLYLKAVPAFAKRPLKQIHLGGGSPTFLSPESLQLLVKGIQERVKATAHDFEGAIEVDPRRTTFAQLKVLRDLGFNRVSMGVQDFNPEVQRLINRIQPAEMTEQVTKWSRELGYHSVNFDLIYGLPKQTRESVREMAEKTVAMGPDRIALYSFALVPWIKPAQRLFRDEDLPAGEEKRELYEISREVLIKGGYREIGMDHFAKQTDALTISSDNGRLHRNFMGYTDIRSDILLGLGVSSISEAPTSFHQNEKALNVYERKIAQNEIPTFRGHILSEQDRQRREQILRFMTQWQVELENEEQAQDVSGFLSQLISDGLVKLEGKHLKLTELGRPFLRNACMALDARLREKQPQTKVFSQSV